MAIKRFLPLILAAPLLLLLLDSQLVSTELISRSAAQTSAPTTASVASRLQNAEFEIEEVTEELGPVLTSAFEFLKRQWSHKELVEYYAKTAGAISKTIPGLTLSSDIHSVLQPYSGSLNLSSYDVHSVPFFLIVPERSFHPGPFRFFKLGFRLDKERIPGLRVSAKRISSNAFGLQREAAAGLEALSFPFIATLNARAFGFTAAAFVPELSAPQFSPSAQFEYLGLKNWENHNRLKPTDQLRRLIRLSNFAHQAGERYVISTHPDFALQTDVAKTDKALLTFFLWESEPGAAINKSELPDFVFQISLDS